jgi:ubiquinone/menaquinone biosynthesis C-methylase UbiE
MNRSNFDRKKHWDNIYQNKNTDEVSWYQPVPATSLDFIKQLDLSRTSKIIDIGGGDSFLVDHLLNLGYQDITVLDISEQAIERAKKRLGDKADKVKWIVADAAIFLATEKYDFWHDRAALHFLTTEKEIDSYVNTLNTSVNPNGYLLIGAFSKQGPKKCSGIEIRQYSENSLTDRLRHFFKKIKCITIDHKTPSGSIQNFIFCSFRRIETA